MGQGGRSGSTGAIFDAAAAELAAALQFAGLAMGKPKLLALALDPAAFLDSGRVRCAGQAGARLASR